MPNQSGVSRDAAARAKLAAAVPLRAAKSRPRRIIQR